MYAKLKSQLTPPLIFNLVKHFKNGFRGDYASYSEALNKCDGYETCIIVEKTLESTLQYRMGCNNNQAVQNQMNLLSVVLLSLKDIKIPNNETINVLDFGGAMGGYYFFLKRHLDSFVRLNWVVCETEEIVKAAKENLDEDGLSFVSSLDQIPTDQKFEIILASSSLQYTDSPVDFFAKLSMFKHDYMIIDRCPMAPINKDRLTIQKVAKSVYKGSYPCWFFSKEKWIELVSKTHDIKLNWNSADAALLDFQEIICQGVLLKSKLQSFDYSLGS
jgi:putative methyltransferase (TIGR04325 family)